LTAYGPSRRAVVLLSPGGERAIISLPEEATSALRVPDAQLAAVVGEAGWVHLDGYALDDVTGDLALAAARSAAAVGVPLSLEPPSTGGLPARRDRLAALPPLALVVGRPDEIAATVASSTSDPAVVVTHDGPEPVTWTGESEAVQVVVPGRGGVATLGAGDRFTGGLLAAVLRGADPADALRAGVAAAFAPPPV
jgi:sugar/nucleoside kinase (ribokinase family)